MRKSQEDIKKLLMNKSNNNNQHHRIQRKKLIEFEGYLFDVYDFLRIEQDEDYDMNNPPNFLNYELILRFKSHPFEKTFTYQSLEDRYKALSNLKELLLMNKVEITE